VNRGSAVSIVYTANEWYRIAALTVNGVAVPGAAGSKSWILSYAQVVGPVAATGTFARLADGENGWAVPTTWLTNWTESAVHSGLDAFDIPTKRIFSSLHRPLRIVVAAETLPCHRRSGGREPAGFARLAGQAGRTTCRATPTCAG